MHYECLNVIVIEEGALIDVLKVFKGLRLIGLLCLMGECKIG
jgi:hypothetical protein